MTKQNTKIDPQAAGVQLAHAMQWEGERIFLAALAALEDANFHPVARELMRTWINVEGSLEGKFYA